MNNVHNALVMAAQKTAITEACNHVYAAGGRLFFSGKIPFSSSRFRVTPARRSVSAKYGLIDTLNKLAGLDRRRQCFTLSGYHPVNFTAPTSAKTMRTIPNRRGNCGTNRIDSSARTRIANAKARTPLMM